MIVGFEFYAKSVHNGLGYSAGRSVSSLWSVAKRSVTAFTELFKPKERKQLHSFVGGYSIAADQFARGWIDGLWILAQISLALGVVNLFPFLPLDGGHIFWALAEKVRGRRIPLVVMERASIVGIALIAIIFVVGFSNDISALAATASATRRLRPARDGAPIALAITSIG